jgi:hypothetical protein
VPKRFELARPIECSRAGFNDNGAAFDVCRRRDKLIAHHPALQNDAAVPVDATELEYILGEIDAPLSKNQEIYFYLPLYCVGKRNTGLAV